MNYTDPDIVWVKDKTTGYVGPLRRSLADANPDRYTQFPDHKVRNSYGHPLPWKTTVLPQPAAPTTPATQAPTQKITSKAEEATA